MTTKKVWMWAVALWLMAQIAFMSVKLWVLAGMSAGVTLIPTWCMAAFAFLYGLWCIITADLDFTFGDDELEDTQCGCRR